jgi:hypothetical protein
MKCGICGTIKNCSKYLDNVLKNMKIIGEIFEDYKIILFYDSSSDETLNIVKNYQKTNENIILYVNKYEISQYRTIRIAYGRNMCLQYINKFLSDYDFFIMMDCDDVCSGKINIDILKYYLKNNDEWDSLSFNSKNYYDIWALSIYPFCLSFFHFKNNPYHIIKKYIDNKLNNLNDKELIECYSAFNGFSIYKLNKFFNCKYDGKFNLNLFSKNIINKNIKFIKSNLDLSQYEDCEHRNFHIEAIKKNNAKIRIIYILYYGK